MNDDPERTELHVSGDMVALRITPDIKLDRTWRQFGKLRSFRHDESGLTCGTIEITVRQMSAEENRHGWLSDDTWHGCLVNAFYNPYDGDWRATRAACDRAQSTWARFWEQNS